MTVKEIREIVVSVDPTAKHYTSSKEGDAFTVWAEYRRIMPDGAPQEDFGWAFEIDRYVKLGNEDDAVAPALEKALAKSDRVAFTYEVDYDPGSGYIRHIFSCEGI